MPFKKKKLKNQRPTLEVCQSESVQNAASTLLANVRFSSVDAPLKTIAVTSSVPNEGKTTVALSLAMAAGRSGDRVLLMECDMRRRSLRAIVGAKPRHGIHALLTGKTTLEDAVVETDFPRVWFLDAEAGIPNPDGILSSRAFGNVLAQLREAYDYVIIDTPPVTAFPDASIVASKTDAAIVVAREKYTDERELTFALQQLNAADANVLGVALNCLDSSASGSYGYYYGYYYDEKEVPADSPEAKSALDRIRKGDTSISVRPASEGAAPDADDLVAEVGDDPMGELLENGPVDGAFADATADAAEPAAPQPAAPTGGPTAAAPGSANRK